MDEAKLEEAIGSGRLGRDRWDSYSSSLSYGRLRTRARARARVFRPATTKIAQAVGPPTRYYSWERFPPIGSGRIEFTCARCLGTISSVLDRKDIDRCERAGRASEASSTFSVNGRDDAATLREVVAVGHCATNVSTIRSDRTDQRHPSARMGNDVDADADVVANLAMIAATLDISLSRSQ